MSNKLVDMELDEISLVKKGANQFSTVSIAKSLSGEEEEMEELFDENGDLVDAESLDFGDVVYDSEGNAFEVTEDEDDDNDDDNEVEKSIINNVRHNATRFAGGFKRGQTARGMSGKTATNPAASDLFDKYATIPDNSKFATKAGFSVGRRPLAYAGGVAGGGAAVGGGGYGYNRRRRNDEVGKSLREEFSKALTDDDREVVISKAMDAISELEEQNMIALEIAKSEQETRIFNEYVSIAKTYDLPFEYEDVAKAMMEAESTLSPESVQIIAKSFELASTLIGDEIGYDGIGSDTMYLMDSALDEIGKSGDPEAIAALLENNPELYDAYLSESR